MYITCKSHRETGAINIYTTTVKIVITNDVYTVIYYNVPIICGKSAPPVVFVFVDFFF